MTVSEWWVYFGVVIALVVVLNIIIGVIHRLKVPKYERPPEFSWEELDGDKKSPSGNRGKGDM